ncbi:MAG TPA: peptidylprolyl isomerase [Oceanipulchritudo sp.]|nr:peptidylprolyl isomerase [Oceanipulchritudo sp.]
MRPLIFTLAALTASCALGQSLLVNTRLQPNEFLDRDEEILLDLTRYFQVYPDGRPVATFTITMPVSEGLETFAIDGQEVELNRYQLADGGTYSDPYSVPASQFLWTEQSIQFALLPEEAPVTVANFMTYAADLVYNNTIVHRNESTGRIFQPGQTQFVGQAFNPLPIIQSGGLRLHDTDDFLLQWIPTRPAIPFEETRDNSEGTIAMARGDFLDTATSQFFINLEDNTNAFGSNWSVFGELAQPEEALPVLKDFADTPVYDLSSPWPSGAPNIFSTLPFQSVPLYAPFPQEKSSFARFSSVTVSEGNPENVTYSWEFVDPDQEFLDSLTEEERAEVEADLAANRAVFDIHLDGPNLSVTRTNTGQVQVRVSGSHDPSPDTAEATAQSASFVISILGFTEGALDQFPDSNIDQDGWIENAWYGWMQADGFPEIFHLNHGYQFVGESEDSTILNAYDFKLDSWFFTDSTIYPNMFLHRPQVWVYYQEGSGSLTSDRWFYLFNAENPRWVRESEL